MATRAPLTVRLSTPNTAQAFDVRDLSFTKSWRGGFKDASVRLLEPLNFRHPMLSPFARMRIDDNRTGKVAWEGYVDLPGKSRGDQGDVWEIGGVGGYARLSDRRKPYIVIDTNLDGFEFHFATKTGRMQAGQGGLPAGAEEGADCILLQWQNGIAVDDQDRVTMEYLRIAESGQRVGGFQFTHREGFASTVQRIQMLAATVGGSEEIARNLPWVLALTQSSAASAGAGAAFAVGRNRLKLRIFRSGGVAQNTDTENWWAGVTEMRISALRKDINGNDISGVGVYDNGYVLAHEVVTDMLSWFDPPIDKASAFIDDTFVYQVDHMVYEDPTTMQDVLDDLVILHPLMVYEVLETNATGDHRFNLRKIDTPLRYVATAIDGWDAPGGEADLRNEVIVSWRDRRNRKQSNSYSTTVAELDQWGITRGAEIVNLGDELGSQANSDRVGSEVLAEVSTPQEAGTLTVARPITDLWTGRDVYPWEIEAGYQILISDIDIPPQPITEVSYRDSDASAVLTVGEPALTTDQLVNLFAKRKRRR